MVENAYALKCPKCHHFQRLSRSSCHHWLQSQGHLLRDSNPDWPLMVELAKACHSSCPSCDHAPLIFEPFVDEWDDGPIRKDCEACGESSAPERLEVFPDTEYCSDCQGRVETGTAERVFCDRCGGLMRTAQSSRGITHYVMRCSDCGHRA